MPNQQKGKVHIDVHELKALVQHLKTIKEKLHEQHRHISTSQHDLDHAISGTAVNVVNFKRRFDHWTQQLNTLTGHIDTAYHTFEKVLEEAEEGDLVEALKELGQ